MARVTTMAPKWHDSHVIVWMQMAANHVAALRSTLAEFYDELDRKLQPLSTAGRSGSRRPTSAKGQDLVLNTDTNTAFDTGSLAWLGIAAWVWIKYKKVFMCRDVICGISRTFSMTFQTLKKVLTITNTVC